MGNRNSESNYKLSDFTNPKLFSVLNRERFTNLLKERYRRKLILIHGKAGQGKTTIAADFIRRMNLTSRWIRLTKKDFDPGLLLNKFKSLIETLKPVGMINTVSADFDHSVNSLINEINNIQIKPCYIVLEDFQNINRSLESCRIINQLIENSQSDVHFILLSREYPKLSLSKLRSKKDLFELTDTDIDFLEEDVQLLSSEIYKLEFTPTEIRKICGIIDGWTTGYIFLFEKLSCTESRDKQNLLIKEFIKKPFISEAVDFFEEQIYSECSGEDRNSLLKLSFFEDITPELAGKLLNGNGEKILNNFMSNGYFLNLSDKNRKYYTFYSIFQYVLQLHSDDLKHTDISELLRIGADFYRKTEDFEKSIVILIKLEQVDKAGELFLEYAEELLDQSKYRKIRRILDLFPSEFIEQNQLLRFNRIIADNLNNPFSTRKKLPELLNFFLEHKDYNRQARIYSVLLANYFFIRIIKRLFQLQPGKLNNFFVIMENYFLNIERKF